MVVCLSRDPVNEIDFLVDSYVRDKFLHKNPLGFLFSLFLFLGSP